MKFGLKLNLNTFEIYFLLFECIELLVLDYKHLKVWFMCQNKCGLLGWEIRDNKQKHNFLPLCKLGRVNAFHFVETRFCLQNGF